MLAMSLDYEHEDVDVAFQFEYIKKDQYVPYKFGMFIMLYVPSWMTYLYITYEISYFQLL